jgi:hypothetical protein
MKGKTCPSSEIYHTFSIYKTIQYLKNSIANYSGHAPARKVSGVIKAVGF